PDSTPALGIGQQRDSVGGAAQFVGVDRLQVLEFEPHVGKSRPELEADQRRADDRPRDPAAGLSDLVQRDWTDWVKHRAWALKVRQKRGLRYARVPQAGS